MVGRLDDGMARVATGRRGGKRTVDALDLRDGGDVSCAEGVGGAGEEEEDDGDGQQRGAGGGHLDLVAGGLCFVFVFLFGFRFGFAGFGGRAVGCGVALSRSSCVRGGGGESGG